MIVVCYGLPGTGKTTVAKELAARLGGVWLSTDAMRKKIIPQPTYTVEEREIIYRVLFYVLEFAQDRLGHVVLDGTFGHQAWRATLAERARAMGAPLHFVECACDPEVALRRIATRQHSDSDATALTYDQLRQTWERNEFPHLTIDTALPVAENIERVVAYLSAGGGAGR
jgi:predicted kinase